MEQQVAAIEAEALAAARERIEALPIWVTYQHPEGPTGDADPVEFETIDRDRVLAAFAAPSDAPEKGDS